MVYWQKSLLTQPIRLLLLFFSFLAMSVGLLVTTPAMLARWVYYLFTSTSRAQLSYFYLLQCIWACWLSFLPYWPIWFILSFFGFSQPDSFTFISCYAYGPTGYHSFHISPFGLLSISLGFPWPNCFTFTSCCAYEPVGYHSCHIGPFGLLPISLGFPNPIALLLPLLFLFSSIFSYCWAYSVVGPFCQKWASTMIQGLWSLILNRFLISSN